MHEQLTIQTKSLSKPTFSPVTTGCLQRQCACGQHTNNRRECEECKKKKEGLLQRAAVHDSPADEIPSIVNHVLSAPGQPLEAKPRAFMELRLGHDFSNVRVHTNSAAAESARAVGALAYTVGQDVVFGQGDFQPGTSRGRRLLAHELTHVIQQSARGVESGIRASAIDPDDGLEREARAVGEAIHTNARLPVNSASGLALQRQPSGSSGSGTARPPHITQVTVNQNTPQRVTATFSDGHTESDECSTGKGHCCFDDSAGTAEGGACSAARSNQVGNNCTPVGDFRVTAKIPVTSGGVRLWTQFHNAKSVALHEYSPVDGTPLSHGCVRMHTQMAQTIFNSARVGVTRVKVEGLARPRCQDSGLQREWEGDFTLAGSTPPDGQTIDPFLGRRLTTAEIARERRHIRDARQEMGSALGVDDAGLDAEIAAVQGGVPIISKIPRCIPALTVEEQAVPSAQSAGFLTSNAATTAAFRVALNRARTVARAEQVVRQAGEQLWQGATAAARAGGAGTDDRQIYWTRLTLTTALRQWNPSWIPNADALRRLHTRLLLLLEQTSRGITATTFPTDGPDLKRILISGFDPFGFPNPGGDIRQSNLSGAAALALDGEILVEGSVSARVEAVVFPVRYADFNEGIVENHLRPHLTGPRPPHLVMSISQGNAQFEFEEWAGRRRSADSFRENLGQASGGTPMSPIVPPGLSSGPEFLRHSVPSAMLGSMRGTVGRASAIPGETQISDLLPGATQPRVSSAGPGKHPGRAVEGSGGGFLSNEIFYRNSLLRTQNGSSVPVIHLHTPILAPGATDAARNTLIDKIRKILRATLRHL